MSRERRRAEVSRQSTHSGNRCLVMEGDKQAEKLAQNSEHQTPSEASTSTTNESTADVISTGGADQSKSRKPGESAKKDTGHHGPIQEERGNCIWLSHICR